MTSQINANPVNYLLELTFDADQVTQTLGYQLYGPNQVECTTEAYGPLAGTFNFNKGDKLGIRVVASKEGEPEPELNVTITDCTLISIKSHQVKELSMFDPLKASTVISDWTKPVVNYDPNENRKTITFRALEFLDVNTENGQWKISGYLSVLMNQATGQSSQLYYFDPEGSVGSGGGFDPP